MVSSRTPPDASVGTRPPTSVTAPRNTAGSILSRSKWVAPAARAGSIRSEEHTSELQSIMRNSYAVFCLKKKRETKHYHQRVQSRDNSADKLKERTRQTMGIAGGITY